MINGSTLHLAYKQTSADDGSRANRLAGELVQLFLGLGLLASNLDAFRLRRCKHRVIVRRCKKVRGIARLCPVWDACQLLNSFQQYLIRLWSHSAIFLTLLLCSLV